MNYALLVGVNAYQSTNVRDLRGCKHDVLAVNNHLKAIFEDDIEAVCLVDEQATRSNIIQHLQAHLGKAKRGELALFYFSGHGTRERSPEAFIDYQSDAYHECLVCHDSLEGGEDLADKEIRFLIRSVAKEGADVVVIFDCCHAGSGARDNHDEHIRSADQIEHIRSKDKFIEGVFEDLAKPSPRHLFFAACLQTELSRERQHGIPPRWGGIFTDALLSTLKSTLNDHPLSYANLEAACRIEVNNRLGGAIQTPNMIALGGFDIHKGFLRANDKRSGPTSYLLQAETNGTWKVPLGSLHGLKDSLATKLSIYEDNGLNTYLGEATLLNIGLYESSVKLPKNFFPRVGSKYSVLVNSLPQNTLPVWVEESTSDMVKALVDRLPDAEEHTTDTSVDWVSKQLVTSLLDFTSTKKAAQFGIAFSSGEIALINTDSQDKLFPTSFFRIEPGTDLLYYFSMTCRALCQISNWEYLNTLNNEKELSSQLQNEIHMRIRTPDRIIPLNVDLVHTLNYEADIPYTLEVANSGPVSLFCNAWYLSRYFQIEAVDNKALPNTGQYKVIDQGILTFPSQKNAELLQLSERFKLIFSRKKLPSLNLGKPQKLEEYFTPQRDRLHIPSMPASLNNFHHSQTWFTKSIHLRL